MINDFLLYIQSIVLEFGIWGVFIVAIIEQIIAPIPSPLIPIMTGFFLLPANDFLLDVLLKSIYLIALPYAFGAIIGSLFIYFLGYFGGKPIIEKSKKWLGFSWENLEKIKKELNKNQRDEFTLFILWFLPVIPSAAISIFCGIVRYSLFKYILLGVSGLFFRAIIISLIGWQAGALYYVAAEQISLIENYILIGFILLILIGIIFLFYKNKKRNYV